MFCYFLLCQLFCIKIALYPVSHNCGIGIKDVFNCGKTCAFLACIVSAAIFNSLECVSWIDKLSGNVTHNLFTTFFLFWKIASLVMKYPVVPESAIAKLFILSRVLVDI